MSRGAFSYSYAIAVVLVIAATIILTLRPITDSDFWHHISFGRVVVEEGRFPGGDELSSTAEGRPWISSGWLPAVALYKIYKSSPINGPVGGFVFGVIFITALILFYYGFRRTRNAALPCLLTLTALAAAYPRFLPRPDLLSQVLLVPLIILLAWYEESPLIMSARNLLRAALLPLLFLLWANSHMLFVIGFAIAGLYAMWVFIQWRRGLRHDITLVALMLVLSAVACIATPYGIRSFWFIIENARLKDVSSRINELKPSWLLLADTAGIAYVLLFALWLSVSGWLAWRQRADGSGWWRWVVLVFLLGLALLQRRQLAVAVFGITPLLMAGLRPPLVPRIFLSPYAIVIPLLFFALLSGARISGSLPTLPAAGNSKSGVDCEWYPCEAVEFLNQNPPPGKLFHDLYTGGFLGYNLTPQTKVFIDGRLEVYNNGTYDDFFAPPEGRMPLTELFRKHDVRSALLDWRMAGQPDHTAASLSRLPDWRLCWFSDHYALFVHADDTTTTYTNAHAYTYLNPIFPAAYTDALSNPKTAAAAQAEARKAISQNPGSRLAKTAMSVAGLKVGM